MGALRTIFAITVLFAHSLGNFFIGGSHSVQLFYMISGFLDFPDFSRHLIMSKMKRRGLYATHQIYGRI